MQCKRTCFRCEVTTLLLYYIRKSEFYSLLDWFRVTSFGWLDFDFKIIDSLVLNDKLWLASCALVLIPVHLVNTINKCVILRNLLSYRWSNKIQLCQDLWCSEKGIGRRWVFRLKPSSALRATTQCICVNTHTYTLILRERERERIPYFNGQYINCLFIFVSIQSTCAQIIFWRKWWRFYWDS